MTHPYRRLPDHQFWRRTVASSEPFLFDPVVETRFTIGQRERVATAGSCFAQHISNRLSRIGFNYFVTEQGTELDDKECRARNYGVFRHASATFTLPVSCCNYFRNTSMGASPPTLRGRARMAGTWMHCGRRSSRRAR